LAYPFDFKDFIVARLIPFRFGSETPQQFDSTDFDARCLILLSPLKQMKLE